MPRQNRGQSGGQGHGQTQPERREVTARGPGAGEELRDESGAEIMKDERGHAQGDRTGQAGEVRSQRRQPAQGQRQRQTAKGGQGRQQKPRKR